MGLTDQKFRFATEEDVKAPWSGGGGGRYFRCKLCGHRFEVGDYYRFVFHKFGNILVCKDCDTNPEEKWTQIHEEWDRLKEGRFWWFIYRLEDGIKELEHEAAYSERDLEADVEYWRNKALYG